MTASLIALNRSNSHAFVPIRNKRHLIWSKDFTMARTDIFIIRNTESWMFRVYIIVSLNRKQVEFTF